MPAVLPDRLARCRVEDWALITVNTGFLRRRAALRAWAQEHGRDWGQLSRARPRWRSQGGVKGGPD